MRVLLVSFALAALAMACESTDHVVVVELRTDYQPGTEFTTVETSIVGETELETASTFEGDDYLAGRRVAEITTEARSLTLQVRLRDSAGATVGERRVVVDVRGSIGVTVVLTRSCADVSCPVTDPALTECVGGRCVDPRCTPENPTSCGVPLCSTDTECPPPTASCAASVCIEETCLVRADDTACPAGAVCDPDVGCVGAPVDAGMDATVDTGVDAELDASVPFPSAVSVTPDPFTTTSTTYIPVPGATLSFDANLPGVHYLLLVSARLQNNVVRVPAVELRYLVDGVQRGFGGVESTAVGTYGSFQHFDVILPETGPHTVTAELRQPDTGSAGVDAGVEDLTIIAVPLRPEADVVLVDEEVDLPIDMEVSFNVTYPVTFPSAGEYVSLGVANLLDTPTAGFVAVGFHGPSAADWSTATFKVVAPTWQPLFNTSVQTVPGGADEFFLVLKSFSTTGARGQGTVRNPRFVAFRTDAFASFQTMENGETIVSGTPDTLLTALTTAPPPEARQQLVLQGIHGKKDCTFSGRRRTSFVTGTQTHAILHDHTCGYESSYGIFRLVEGSAALGLSNAFSPVDSAETATSRDSFIRAFGLP